MKIIAAIKKLILCLVCITCCITLISCNKEDSIETSIPSEIQTELGVPFDELKGDMTNFVIKTYMPSKDSIKSDYIKDIDKYLSETEYNLLLEDIGDYYGDIKTEVKDLKIQYGLAENNTDNSDKILISFYLHKEANEVHVRNRVNLVFTIQGGEIAHHSVYMGQTEKRSE